MKSHNRVSIDAVPSTGIWEWFAKLMEGEENEEEEGEKGIVSKCSVIFRLTTNQARVYQGWQTFPRLSQVVVTEYSQKRIEAKGIELPVAVQAARQ